MYPPHKQLPGIHFTENIKQYNEMKQNREVNLSLNWLKLHSVPGYICLLLSFTHLSLCSRSMTTPWGGGDFLVVIYVEEQPLCKDRRGFNLFWICHVKDIMQCFHNSKSMDKIYASTHRDVLNFNMKNTFLVRRHIIWRKVHTTNDNSWLIISSFLEKIVWHFSEIEG